jgi:hypothetical protein
MEWKPSSSSFAKTYGPQGQCRLVLPIRAGKTQCFARRGSARIAVPRRILGVAAHAEGFEVLECVRATLRDEGRR